MENILTVLLHLTAMKASEIWCCFSVSPSSDASLRALVDPRKGHLRPFPSGSS